ncbi:cadherin-23-like [Ruditapes philippinarum]|uniref:cadherin-23-like n=1 Tax=Ruditapes philippinarum TaxID=129788 RepID=UPI00295AEE38|nr:cadherin-23-like [Ruditapes philippinarum]
MTTTQIMEVAFFVILTSSLMKGVTSQCNAKVIGEQNPAGKAGKIDGNSNVGYILRGNLDNYNIDCCGTITEWQLVANLAGTVYLQVWRPTTGNDYQLVGENVESVVLGTNSPITIAAGDQISVRPGDRIGWFADGANIIEHKGAGGSPDVTTQAMTRPPVLSTVTWFTTFDASNTYAIRAEANGGTGPTVDSPADNSVFPILNNVAIGTFITTITWSDPDVGDELTTTMTANSKFTFVEGVGTGTLSVASSLAGPDSTESLIFTVTDFCGNTDSITIDVQIINEAPVLHDMPAAVTLSEDATTKQLLYTINATDTVDPVTCVFSPAVTDPFSISQISGTSEYGIYVDDTPNLDYNTQRSYTFTVKCNDGYKDSNTGTFYVYLVKNQAPVIHNLQAATTISTTDGIGTNVFSVNATDAEDDTISYTMTCNPTPCPFTIFASGEIQLNADISNYNTVGYDIEITVADDKNTASPKILTVLIRGNKKGENHFLRANDVIGTPSYGVRDQDNGDTKTYSINCGADTAKFYMDSSTGQVSFQSDYSIASTTETVTCTVTVVDSGGLTDTATLYIYISDRNDNTPVFSPASYSFYVSYYASVGTVVGTVTASDNDTGTFGTLTYILTQTSLLDDYFAIDNNGQITVLKSPVPLNFSTTVYITATATDGGGLSDTSSISITISDTTTTSTTTSTDRFKTFMEDSRNIPWLVSCIIVLALITGILIWIIGTCSGEKGCGAFQRHIFGKKRKIYRPRIRRLPTPQTPPEPRLSLPSFLVSVRHPPPPKGEQAWRSSVDRYV